MALRAFTGCAYYDTAHATLYWDVFQDVTIGATAGRLGTPGLVGGITAYTRVRCAKKVTLIPYNEIYMGWWVDEGTGPSGAFAAFNFASVHGVGPFTLSTKQITLCSDTTGKAYVTRGNWTGPTILGPTTGVVLGSGTRFIELHAVIHATQGIVEVRVDNQTVLYGTGLNTQALSTPVIGGFEVIPWTVDDVYVCDTSGTRNTGFLGKGFHVLDPRPVSDGDEVQWLPLSGANYAAVDDASPDDGATYVRAPFAGRRDLYHMTPLVGTYDVFALQSNAMVSKSALSSIAQFANGVRIGAGDYQAPSKAITSSPDFRLYQDIWDVAPDDGTPWTYDKLNISQAAIQRTL